MLSNESIRLVKYWRIYPDSHIKINPCSDKIFKSNENMLQHKHLIISALVSNPISDVEETKKWLNELIDVLEMQPLLPVIAAYCNMSGNKGITGTALIATSHIVVHFWDEQKPAKMELDIYSCKDFSMDQVQPLVARLSPVSMASKFLDRTSGLTDLTN